MSVVCQVRFTFPTMAPPDQAPIVDAAFASLQGLARAKIPTFALSSTGMSNLDQRSRWFPYRNLFFGRVLADSFINLCVGFGGDFDRLWCLNRVNIMITGPWGENTPKQVEDSKKWKCISPDFFESPLFIWKCPPAAESLNALVADALS